MWIDDIIEGNVSVIKFRGQTVVRLPVEMGNLLGKRRIIQMALSIFDKESLRKNLFYVANTQYGRMPIYEIQLPSVRRYEDMCGPDGVDFFAQQITDSYNILK